MLDAIVTQSPEKTDHNNSKVWLIYPADKSLSMLDKYFQNVLSYKEDSDLFLNEL